MKTPSEEPIAKILVVDDEPAILRLVKLILIRAKYQVTPVESGEDALDELKKSGFDLIVTDAMMPGMSGFDLVQRIRNHSTYSKMPILMLTRRRERGDVKQAIEVGVTDYVMKPIDDSLLLEKVELCIRKGSGAHHIFTAPVFDPQSRATLQIPCRVVSLSESELNLQTPFPIDTDFSFDLLNPVFSEIGISVPLLKRVNCIRVPEMDATRPALYEVKFGFVGLPEADLKKIRAWLQKQALKLRK